MCSSECSALVLEVDGAPRTLTKLKTNLSGVLALGGLFVRESCFQQTDLAKRGVRAYIAVE